MVINFVINKILFYMSMFIVGKNMLIYFVCIYDVCIGKIKILWFYEDEMLL